SSARTEHRDEVGDAALGLLPDFVGGRVIVGLPVGVVGILVGVEILLGMFAGQLARLTDRAVGTVVRIGINNVGSVALENLFAFARNVFWHAERDGEGFGGSQHGVGDAGIAAGGVEKNLAGAKLATGAALGDDARGGAILDRSARVVPLGLAQKCYAGQVAGECVEAKQRSVADALDQAVSESFA